jgi:hypothetical protein
VTVAELIELLESHGVRRDEVEVVIDGATREGEGIELKPLLTRVRGGRLLIVADEVTGG